MAIKVSKNTEIKIVAVRKIYNPKKESQPDRPTNLDEVQFYGSDLTHAQLQLIKTKATLVTPDEEDILKTSDPKEVRPYLKIFLDKYDLEMDTPTTPLSVLIAIVDAQTRSNASYNQINFYYAVLVPTQVSRTLSDKQKGYLKEIENILIKYKVHLSDTDYEIAIKNWYSDVTICIKAYGDGWDKTPEEFFEPSDLKKLESINKKLKLSITNVYAD